MLTKPYQSDDAEAPEDERIALGDVEVREHLNFILASDEFSSSRRASELFQHLVERALAGDTGSLKERLLGMDIFHRRSDYNTSTDAIVRVTANDVRRRLAQFYVKNPVHPIRILLPLGSYVPDFIAERPHEPDSVLRRISATASEEPAHHTEPSESSLDPLMSSPAHIAPPQQEEPLAESQSGRHKLLKYGLFALILVIALAAGWWARSLLHPYGMQDGAYSFYPDLLGPIGLPSSEKSEIAITNPHMVLYLGLTHPGPALGSSLNDIPVPDDMAQVLNKTANDTQADFPYHHFFVDMSNYTGLGEAKAAFGLARTLEATGRSAQLTEERFLNWQTARQEQLIILGAPHESAFVQETLSAANFTIGYSSIHNAHPTRGEQEDYVRSKNGDALEDYGLIWMTQSPSGTRILVLAGLTSAGTAGVGEFFSDPKRMWPVYQQLRAAAGGSSFPDSWQVLLRIEARQDVPISVTLVAVRITRSAQR